MNLLPIIDILCDVTAKQSELLRKLVTDIENIDQVSKEMKEFYRSEFEKIEDELDVAEYGNRDIPIIEDGVKEMSKRSF